jgi:hypothetical protein
MFVRNIMPPLKRRGRIAPTNMNHRILVVTEKTIPTGVFPPSWDRIG